jgi:hypothetical protein
MSLDDLGVGGINFRGKRMKDRTDAFNGNDHGHRKHKAHDDSNHASSN